MNEAKIILRSKIEDLKPVYVLYGEESYLIEDFVKKFVARFVDPQMKDFMLNQVKVEDEEFFESKLYEVCNTMSMISPYRIVIAYAGQRFSEKGDDTYLVRLFENFPQGTILLLIADKKPNKKLTFVRKLTQIGAMLKFSPLMYQNLSKWIERQFTLEKKKVARQGIELLEEYFHNNLQQLKSEIEKIITFVADRNMVTLDDIRAVVSKDSLLKDTVIFELVDAVGNRKTRDALLILENMEREGESLFLILTMFIRQLRLIIYSKEMSERGFSPADTAKRLGQHPFPIKKCYRQARNFTMKELELALERLLKANYDIVSGRYPEKLSLQLALMDLKDPSRLLKEK